MDNSEVKTRISGIHKNILNQIDGIKENLDNMNTYILKIEQNLIKINENKKIIEKNNISMKKILEKIKLI